MADEKHRQAVGTFRTEHCSQDRLREKTRDKTTGGGRDARNDENPSNRRCQHYVLGRAGVGRFIRQVWAGRPTMKNPLPRPCAERPLSPSTSAAQQLSFSSRCHVIRQQKCFPKGGLLDLPSNRIDYFAAAATACSLLLAASFFFSAYAWIAGPNCAITASRLNEVGFWRGGYFTYSSICAATMACVR